MKFSAQNLYCVLYDAKISLKRCGFAHMTTFAIAEYKKTIILIVYQRNKSCLSSYIKKNCVLNGNEKNVMLHSNVNLFLLLRVLLFL